MQFAACRAGDWVGDCDVAKVGDIASDARWHCGIHSWASDHHHVRLFCHGSVGRHAKEKTFSHNRDKACKKDSFNDSDRRGDRSWNTHELSDNNTNHYAPPATMRRH